MQTKDIAGYDKLVEPFGKDDLDDEMSTDVLKKESVFKRLNDVFTPIGWGITYVDLGKLIACTITIAGTSKTGIGDSVLESVTDAMRVWGVQIPSEESSSESQLPPPPPPPPPAEPTVEFHREGGLKPPPPDDTEPQTTGKVWTDERSEKMRTIKTKLKIRDNGEFGPHIEMWSKGRLDSIVSLTPKDADEFIKYMMDKYINRIGTGVQPSADTNEDEE